MIIAYFLLGSRANKYSRTNFYFGFRRMKVTNGSEKKITYKHFDKFKCDF